MNYENKTKQQLILELIAMQKKIKELEESLKDTTCFDPLTGLPNRFLFYDRLTQAIALASRRKKSIAVMFISINRLKLINDMLGNEAGDLLIKSAGERIKRCLRESDTLARPGRDEFMVLLQEITNMEDVALVAQKISATANMPFVIWKNELFIDMCIGISIYPNDGNSADTILKNAYTAMLLAKEESAAYQYFSIEMNTKAFERLSMENSLQLALNRNELIMHYQPQIDLNTGEIIGMEALIRWNKPDTGMTYPKDFIPFAEGGRLIHPLGKWALSTACKQNKEWRAAGLPPVRVAVNISAKQFQNGLESTVSNLLKETGVEPSSLELELTENIFIQNRDETIRILNKLKDMGIHITLDDFGSGYSCLCYLRYIPLDKLKIGETLTCSPVKDTNTLAILKAIVGMAHSLNLKVIAEGIETQEQLDFIRSIGFDAVQGHLFSYPLPSDEATKLLANRDRLFS